MTGGISPSLARISLIRALCCFSMLVTLSACGLMHQPAPVIEGEVEPVETEPAQPPEAPASAPVAAAAPTQAAPTPAENNAPKKPHHEAPPRPRPVHPTPPPAPPAPPPLFMTRQIQRDEIHSVLDSEVQRRGGKVIGRAVDVVVDALGMPRDMILNLTGFMGVGDRKLAFPWPLFRFPPGGHGTPIVLDVAAAPTPRMPLPSATPNRLPLMDTTLERSGGGTIGRVVDVLVDRSAVPQALIVDLNGLADARHTIAVNWEALHFAVRGNVLHAILDLNDVQLRNAPVYAGDKPITAISPPPAAGGARR